jgi:hypothetical protein
MRPNKIRKIRKPRKKRRLEMKKKRKMRKSVSSRESKTRLEYCDSLLECLLHLILLVLPRLNIN